MYRRQKTNSRTRDKTKYRKYFIALLKYFVFYILVENMQI